MSTTSELVERLRGIAEWTAIIEQHRRKTDDPSITYVLKDGTRIHEDDSSIAKLAASLSRVLEDAAVKAGEGAARLDELERENAALREALKPFAEMNIVSFGQRRQGMGPYLTSVWFDGYSTPVEKHQRARAALAGSGEK